MTGLKSKSDARMKLVIPRVDEPDWGEEDNLDEEPVDIKIGAQFADLEDGKTYTVLKFECASAMADSSSKYVDEKKWVQSW